MRSPGGLQGIFANRPSTGAVPLDHVLPLCSDIDTAGVFSRDAATWSTVMHAWYRNFTNYCDYPRRIFYPLSSFPNANTKAGAMLEGTVLQIERFLGTKREHVDISTHWMETHRSGAPGGVTSLLNTVRSGILHLTAMTTYQKNRHMLCLLLSDNTALSLYHSTETMRPNTKAEDRSSTQDL